MTKGICAGSLTGESTAARLALARDAGFDSVEFAIASEGPAPSLESDTSALRELAKLAADHGLALSSLLGGLFWQVPLTADDPDVRERSVAAAERCLEVGAALGVGCLLLVPGSVYLPHVPAARQVRYDEARARALEGLQRIARRAEAVGVDVGIENVWNGFLLSPTEFAGFVDEVGSERVGAYFDAGNVLPLGDPADWIDILGHRLKRVHVKDYRRSVGTIDGFVPLLSGDVPWDRVVAALERVGYDGPLTAEMGHYRHFPEAVAYHTSVALDYILGRR